MNDNKRPGDPEPEDHEPPKQHSHMAVPPQSQPGAEFDGHGNVIPFERRTSTDKGRARSGRTRD